MIKKGGPKNILYIHGSISEEDAERIHEWVGERSSLTAMKRSLLCLENVAGGHITIGTIEMLMEPTTMIDTWGIGNLYSAGAALLCCGKNRMVHPNTELMFHQPKGDLKTVVKYMNFMLNVYASFTGLTDEEVVTQIFNNYRDDHYMSVDRAFQLRLIDRIMTDIPDIKEYGHESV